MSDLGAWVDGSTEEENLVAMTIFVPVGLPGADPQKVGWTPEFEP